MALGHVDGVRNRGGNLRDPSRSLWAGAPPDSLDRWHAAPFKIDPGLRFWVFCTPGLGLLSVGVFVSFFSIPGTPALFIKTGSALTLALVVWAFAWFVPTFRTLIGPKFKDMDRAQAARSATLWRRLNLLRVVVFFVAWTCTATGAIWMEKLGSAHYIAVLYNVM